MWLLEVLGAIFMFVGAVVCCLLWLTGAAYVLGRAGSWASDLDLWPRSGLLGRRRKWQMPPPEPPSTRQEDMDRNAERHRRSLNL